MEGLTLTVKCPGHGGSPTIPPRVRSVVGHPLFAAVALRVPRSPAEPKPPWVTGWVLWAALRRTVWGQGHAVPLHPGEPPALAFLLLPASPPRPSHTAPRAGGRWAYAGRGLRCPPRLGTGTGRVPASLWPHTHPGSPHRDAPWDSLRESCKTQCTSPTLPFFPRLEEGELPEPQPRSGVHKQKEESRGGLAVFPGVRGCRGPPCTRQCSVAPRNRSPLTGTAGRGAPSFCSPPR